MSDDDRLTIARYLGRDDIAAALRSDARDGLTSRPKELPPKWFYDERGSVLFDEITRLAEYYPTEAERQALYRSAEDIVGLSGADTVMELGSGSSDKTRVLLDAFDGRRRRGHRDFGRLVAAIRAVRRERHGPRVRCPPTVGPLSIDRDLRCHR